MRAYKLTRPDCPGWMFAGVTAQEAARCLENEIDSSGLEENELIFIEAYETTQEEIDALPEFEGW